MQDIAAWAPAASPFIALASLGWGVWIWLAAARRRELAELQGQFRELERHLRDREDAGARARGELRDRMVLVEQRLEHMPTIDQHQRLEVGLAEIRGAIATMAESIKPLARASQRIEDFLLARSEP